MGYGRMLGPRALNERMAVRDCRARRVHWGVSSSALAAAFFFLFPPAALAQDELWSFQIGVARSDVSIAGNDVVWGRERAQITYQNPSTGGFYFAFEIQRRDQLVDRVFIAAGYRRLGDWTLNGRVGYSPDPEFYFQYLAEGAISRRLVGTLVGTVAYRYLNFPAANVRILSPAATYYFAKGEIQGQVYLARNQELEVDSSAYAIRGIWYVTPRFRLAGGLALGERLFDVTSLVGEPAEGWITFADLRFGVTLKDQVGIEIGLAHEEPSFDRRRLGFYYRRSF